MKYQSCDKKKGNVLLGSRMFEYFHSSQCVKGVC